MSARELGAGPAARCIINLLLSGSSLSNFDGSKFKTFPLEPPIMAARAVPAKSHLHYITNGQNAVKNSTHSHTNRLLGYSKQMAPSRQIGSPERRVGRPVGRFHKEDEQTWSQKTIIWRNISHRGIHRGLSGATFMGCSCFAHVFVQPPSTWSCSRPRSSALN